MLKPAPMRVAALIVSGAVPEEVSVSDCLLAVLTVTLPKARLVALTLSAAVPVAPADCALSCMAKLWALPPPVAVNVAVCEDVTGLTVAVKDALAAFAGTATVAGTVTAELSLVRLTVVLLLLAELSVTVQVSLSLPVMFESLQESALTAGIAALPPVVVLPAVVYV